MPRILLGILAILWASSLGWSQEVKPTEAPFLWRIEGETPSYLFGTIHVPDKRVTTLPPSVEAALAACQELNTELTLDMGTQMQIFGRLQLPQGQSLKTILPKDLYERLDNYFKRKKFPFAVFQRMKVWAVSAQLPMLDMMSKMAGAEALDQMLYTKAQKAGKKVGGLETVDEQMNVFDSVAQDDQIEMLRKTLDMLEEAEKKGEDSMGAIIDVYLQGDLDKLWAVLFAAAGEPTEAEKALNQRLIDDRNAIMAERIAAKIKANPKTCYFFAVGTGHYPKDNGILALLRAQGFKITRVTDDTVD